MLAWAKHEAKTSRTTKQLKSEREEPLGATRWGIIPPLALQLMTIVLESVVSIASSPEVPLVTRMMIARSRTPVRQLESAILAQLENSEPPRTEI